MEKLHDICGLKERLIGYAQSTLDCADVETNGQIIDMIKDLYEAEEKAYKSCYYKMMIEHMKKEEVNPQRYGYDHWRYASSGQYAPKGHGEYSAGYPMDEMMMEHPEWGNRRYGYTMDQMERGMMNDAYQNFLRSRKHYHETKSPEDRKAMEHHAQEHMDDTLDSMKDIWESASPELRKEMKKNLTNLVNGMTV